MIWKTHSNDEIKRLMGDYIDRADGMHKKFAAGYVEPLHKVIPEEPFEVIAFSEQHGVIAGWIFNNAGDINFIDIARKIQSDPFIPDGTSRTEMIFGFFQNGRVLTAIFASFQAAMNIMSMFPVPAYVIHGEENC